MSPQNMYRKVVLGLMLLVWSFDANAGVLSANPENYLALIQTLAPGDTLILRFGIYKRGLPIHNLNGTAVSPIVILGDEKQLRPVFWGRSCCNTISIKNSSYITIRNLVLDGRGLDGDAVKAEGNSEWAHHITLENLLIYGYDADQQIVGINTKCPAWDWVIRNNVIRSSGTGIYLGNSDGSAPFVNGLIEFNVVMNTLGYNLEIKHQNRRPAIPEMPSEGTTIIRHNVFSKAGNAAGGANARPNVLVGHWPLSGNGVNDVYQIYGNFFYQNPTEALFQGEGNIALHHNLFVNDHDMAINVRPHNDVPRMIRVFYNTVVANGVGIRVTGGASAYRQVVIGNAVFARTPIIAPGQAHENNLTAGYRAAVNYLARPFAGLGELDLYPKPGKLTGPILDVRPLEDFYEWDRDFNGAVHNSSFRGAYSGDGRNPGWLPSLKIKKLRKGGTR